GSPEALPRRPRRAARLSDGGPGDPLGQECRRAADVRGEHDGTRRFASRGSGGDPPRGWTRRLMPTNGSADDSLSTLVERITSELGGVAHREIGGATEYQRSGSAFAIVRGQSIELRLRPDIAEAALRTPATAPSARGAEWITFEPNPHAPQDVDRLRAWLTI